MRSILFKAKKLSDGKWVKGSLVKTPFGTFIEWYEDSICNKREVDPSTVCQFTGLTDCENNEIWEGDILEGESKSEIVYNKGTFAISFIGYNKRVFSYPLCYYIKEDETVDGKVVGNKFDKKK